MQVPDDLKYTTEHEWVKPEGKTVVVGITDFAQDSLGDIVYVQLPQVGSKFESGATLGEIESTKSVSDIYCPVSGTVTEIKISRFQPQQIPED
jgi:glycine cleavage system H protein